MPRMWCSIKRLNIQISARSARLHPPSARIVPRLRARSRRGGQGFRSRALAREVIGHHKGRMKGPERHGQRSCPWRQCADQLGMLMSKVVWAKHGFVTGSGSAACGPACEAGNMAILSMEHNTARRLPIPACRPKILVPAGQNFRAELTVISPEGVPSQPLAATFRRLLS